MTFFQGKGRNNGDKISIQRIIDFSKWDGKPLQQVKTLWGEPLINFHHRLLTSRFPKTEISDNTGWLQHMGGKPALFWPKLMALFICDGVLFENFHSEGQEFRFTKNIIQPALAEIKDRFGLQPLIVSLVPLKEERKSRWAWYPGELLGTVQHALKVPAQPAFGTYQTKSEIAL